VGLLDFPSHFSPPARVLTVDRNCRSTQPILSAANAVIGLAAERFTKVLWTEQTSEAPPRLVTVRSETDQARYVVEQVLERRETGTALKQQVVLLRTSCHSGPLEVELTRRNIPYVLGPSEATVAAGQGPRIDVGAKLRNMGAVG
jgi:DNA helicase-2/ATP-dependent DNA helicase PcrA